MTLSRFKVAAAVALVLGLFSASPAESQTPDAAHRGLWLLPRKDTQNTARADVPGNMKTAPKEVWRYGGDRNSFASIAPVRVKGKEAYLTQVRSGLRLVRSDGTIVWERPKRGVGSVVRVEDFDGDGTPEALVTLGQTGIALLDAATGETRWTWATPAGAFVGTYQIWRQGKAVRFICFPQNSLHGVCLDLTSGGKQPRVLWDRDYPNTFWQGFGPLIVLADMDNDGTEDVVLAGKPGYVAVIDAETGAIKFDMHHDITGGDHAGRPYGLLQATDLDGDGYRDVVMLSCQVEEYAMIVHNEAGKSLRPVWSLFLEHDLPDDFRELRPNVTSVVDLDGDGKKELIVGLFNITGDDRWHTVVLDPMGGFNARRADLPDRYFWGCYDLNGDGRPEIITSTEKIRRTSRSTTVQIVDGRTFRDVATINGAALATTGGGPLPSDMGFMANRATPIFLQTPSGDRGLLLTQREGKPTQTLLSLRGGEPRFHDLHISPVSYAVLLSTGVERLDRLDREIRLREAHEALAATAPLVGMTHGKREIVFALSNGTVMGGEPDLKASGKFRRAWTVPGEMPALWDGPNGEQVVCTVQGETLRLSHPEIAGGGHPPDVIIPLPYPFYRTGITRNGPTLMPFGSDRLRVYVGLQTGVHTLASALYDADGKRLWLDEKEGPYPRTAAEADLSGRGEPTLIVDNHGKHLLYDLAGQKRVIAHGWHDTIPGRADGAKYVVPIVGPFGPNGETRIVMTSGLQSLETLDAQGARLAKSDFASAYEFEWCGSAAARMGTGTGWVVGMTNKDGILHCLDVTTCQTRWTFDLGCHATLPINVVAADVDGDGRDNFLVGLPNGDLIALDEKDGKPIVLWKMTFDQGVRDTIVADVDGDGIAEIIVETEEGCIHLLRAGS